MAHVFMAIFAAGGFVFGALAAFEGGWFYWLLAAIMFAGGLLMWGVNQRYPRRSLSSTATADDQNGT